MSDGVVILGAGFAGLSAAFHLGKGFEVFEARDFAGGRHTGDAGHLPQLNDDYVKKMVEGLLRGHALDGGVQVLVDALVVRVKKISFGQKAVEIDPRRNAVVFNTGYTAWYDTLISTIPYTELVGIIKGVPADIAGVAVELESNPEAAAPVVLDYLRGVGILSIGRLGVSDGPGLEEEIMAGRNAAVAIS